MSSKFKLSISINTTNAEANLNFDVFLNEELIRSGVVRAAETIEHEVLDDIGEHELKFVMSGKLPEHTKIDDNGTILKDSMITVNDIKFDGLDGNQIVTDLATYTHNFNGHGEETTTTFYKAMGCNGTVKVKFSTPIYIWILENT